MIWYITLALMGSFSSAVCGMWLIYRWRARTVIRRRHGEDGSQRDNREAIRLMSLY